MATTPPLRLSRSQPAWAALLTLFLIVAILSTAKAVLVPLALGVILAFTLTPLVRMFDRLRLPRMVGVAFTLAVLLAAMSGLAYVITAQVTELSEQANKYRTSMRNKVQDLRVQSDGSLKDLTKTVDTLAEQFDENADELRRAETVRVIPERLTPVERLRAAAGSIFEPIASAIIVLVLVAFMLGQREDLRDRFIRLIGPNNITLTTRLLDEAAHRVSQFLIAQTLINIAVGILVTGGLYWIGVPYAVLWGGLTAVLRFVPYVGTTLSALMPAALAFAVFPGWTEVIQTLALFAVLDLVAAYFVEPVILGHRTGVSSFALLVSALFWIWVWGPIGLLLATPLTVCVGVLGRHVRSLGFLGVIFADEPALPPQVRYYQRLLARDEDEAATMLDQKLVEMGRTGVLDSIVIPTLALAHQHREREEITERDANFVFEATHDLVHQLKSSNDPRSSKWRLVGLAPANDTDQSLLDVVARGIDAPLPMLELISPDLSLAEIEGVVAQMCPAIVLIAAVTPQGATDVRSYCRKLRSRLGNTKMVVLRPLDDASDGTRTAQRIQDAGADAVVGTLHELLELIDQWSRASLDADTHVASSPEFRPSTA